MVLIYPIGVPLFVFAALFCYRKRIDPPLDNDDYGLSDSLKNKMRSSEELIRVRSTKEIAKGIDKRDADAHLGWLKFLYEDYEPRCWWFTVVELLRRLWLTALIALLPRGKVNRALRRRATGAFLAHQGINITRGRPRRGRRERLARRCPRGRA